MKQIRKRLTYANVMSSIAVFLMLGGATAIAAKIVLPKNSVGSKQLKKNAVTSAKVKNNSLRAADFKAGQLPAGPQGAQGPPGPAGRSALTPLQAGETETGVIGLDVEAPAASGDFRATASYPIPRGTVPTIYIDGVSAGENCTGTSDNPTAPAGETCIYPTQAGNPSLGPSSHGTLATAGKYGFRVIWSVTATGDTYFYGSWASTGP